MPGPIRRVGYEGIPLRQVAPAVFADAQPLGSDRSPHLDQGIPTGSITADKLAPGVIPTIPPDLDPGFGITSGSLSTITFSSGTGKQVDTTAARFLVVPITVGTPTSTLAEALSPDNSTYTTVVTNSWPDPGGGASPSGIVYAVRLFVPAAWYVKLTSTNSTIGTGHYY